MAIIVQPKPILRKLVALIVCISMLYCGLTLNVQADETLVDVKNNQYYTDYTKLLNGTDVGIVTYPTVQSITANNTNQNRLTQETSKIKVVLRDRVKIAVKEYNGKLNDRITSLDIVVLSGNLSSVDNIKVLGKQAVAQESTNVWYLQKNGYTFNDISLKNISLKFPIEIGFRIKTAQHPNDWAYYGLGTFIAGKLVDPKLSINDGLKPTDTFVQGTGIAGNTITSSARGQVVTTKVDEDGKYSLNLGTTLESFLGGQRLISIVETNLNGDSATASKTQLEMSAAEKDPAFIIDDVGKYTGSDEKIRQILSEKFGIKVENGGGKATLQSEESHLEQLIKEAKVGEDLNLRFYATEPGYIQSNVVTIKLTKPSGKLIFVNEFTNLYFSDEPIALPMHKTMIWPTGAYGSWKLKVMDERSQKTPWKLLAKATKSGDDSEYDLSHYLKYDDGRVKGSLSGAGLQIYDSKNDNSALFERDFESKKTGIFIDADPSMHTGKYVTTITWTLQVAP